MTGPRTSLLLPQHRRGRHLLPFIVAILCGQLACSNDQTTGPTPSNTGSSGAAAVWPRPKIGSVRSTFSGTPYRVWPSYSSSGGAAAAVVANGPSVLVLADTDVVATSALATSLADGGAQVTVRPAPEYTWDGTNPSLTGFDVVVHLNGTTFDFPLPTSAQTALTNFVSNGGGFVGSRFNGYESQPAMDDLVLLGMGGNPDGPEMTCSPCDMTYQQAPAGVGHPVLQGLPASFSFTADANDAGPAAASATVLMEVPSGGPAVLVRQFGNGRVVNFSIGPNYPFDDNVGGSHDPVTLQDPNIQQLYLNAVQWAAGSGSGTAQPQTITFGPLANKVYGDADFTISASTSSGLPVNFTTTGDCTVLGNTVSIDAAGACTVTAHQAGNDEYLPAEDVAQSFTIAKAQASISLLNTVTTYDGTVKGVQVATAPAGLNTVMLSYSLGGTPVTAPVNAGSYQVSAVLDNPNYEGQNSTTFTINQATPVISWVPGALSSGTPLGPAQLNASASGIGGAALSGSFAYTPAAGTSFDAGVHSLSVHFTPSSANYTAADQTVSITVSGSMTFTGFFAPIRNLPYVNVVLAGSAVPVKFSVGGYRGLQVIQAGSPTSVPVACDASAPRNAVRAGVASVQGLRSMGYSYTYVWKTNPSWRGTCRKLVVTLADGSTHEAVFNFTSPTITSSASAAKRLIGR